MRSNRVARNREFSFVLHSEERLRQSLLGVVGRRDRSERTDRQRVPERAPLTTERSVDV